MCETTYCLYPMFPQSTILDICLVIVSAVIVWKVIKSIVDTIPVVG